jgi:hypothetical protein
MRQHAQQGDGLVGSGLTDVSWGYWSGRDGTWKASFEQKGFALIWLETQLHLIFGLRCSVAPQQVLVPGGLRRKDASVG